MPWVHLVCSWSKFVVRDEFSFNDCVLHEVVRLLPSREE